MTEDQVKEGILTTEQAWQMDDDHCIQYLLDEWGLKRPVIRGRLRQFGSAGETALWELKEARNRSGNDLRYPLKDLKPGRARRIFAGFNLPFDGGELVEARFELSDKSERKKSDNPLAISLVEDSIEQLKSIPSTFVQLDDEGQVLVEDTLYRNYVATQKNRLKDELSESAEKLEEIKRRIAEKEKEFEEAQAEAQDAWKEVQQLTSETDEAREEKEAAEERAKSAQKKFDTLKREIDERKADLQRELKAARQDIEDELSAYEKEAEERKAQLMNDVLKLQNYVTQRADQLHRLDLISDKQRDALADTPSSETPPDDALRFSEDLGGDYQRLIDHVQAFLLDNEILYPRFLLEDFLTLLRTHDLIILSGLSGSGKTQLVHSFADALGGKAHVIPVKPNWTSSEDLLGYYNPLQKSYLTTPFLDALIEAKRDSGRLHFICLDEMNLARVEYYFADFLSRLEERGATPKLPLYSTEEAGHVEAEFRTIMEVIDEAENRETRKTYDSFGELLRDEKISSVLQEQLGIKSGKSFVELHARLRRILAHQVTLCV